jgi:hypothetical protein
LKKSLFVLLIFVFGSTFNTSFAQVGIGTSTPDSSAVLDISSTTKGMLAPRLTTVERMAINAPAESLLVYDTDANAFYYYDTSLPAWVKINGSTGGGSFEYRDNWKLIKSAADLSDELTAGGGTEYLLDENILYEINGMITLLHPINLNNAYLTGQDSGEDILLKTHAGTLYQGSGGGSIQKLILTSHPSYQGAGSIFNMTGVGMTDPTSFLLFRDCIVKDNASIGSINNFNLVFFSIIQFLDNDDGITYSNISSLLLQNQGWSGSTGTFEKLTGTFGLVQKASGFSVANGDAVAFDVSADPNILTSAVMLGTVFTGSSTQPFVKPYTIGTADTYTDYNFTNVWTVNCPGIVAESDAEAFGNVFLTGTPLATTFTSNNQALKVAGTTTTVKHFRTGTGGQPNRLVYQGKAKRQFFISATMTVDADNRRLLRFYIAKNGILIPSTGISTYVVGQGDIKALSFTGAIDLAPGDYIELWAENKSGNSSVTLTVEALNMLIY